MIYWILTVDSTPLVLTKKSFTDFRLVQDFKRRHVLLQIIGLSHLTTRPTASRFLRDDVSLILDGLNEIIIT